MWMYLKCGETERKGPIAENILKRMLDRRILNENDLAWSEGMAEWKTFAALSEFKEVALLAAMEWVYLDDNRDTKGALEYVCFALWNEFPHSLSRFFFFFFIFLEFRMTTHSLHRGILLSTRAVVHS
jgi:hypothetical protein